MGLLRSEEMTHGMLVLPSNEARKYVDELGKKTSIQFEDMNAKEMRRPHRGKIQRLEEMERILRFLHEEARRLNMAPATCFDSIQSFLENDSAYEMTAVENRLKKLYKDFTDLNENDAKLIFERNQVQEEHFVLQEATRIMSHSHSRGGHDEEGLKQPLAPRVLKTVAGVISSDQQVRFARTVFRATRGNTFAHYSPIPDQVVDPKTGALVQKSIFVIVFQGSHDSTSSALHDKVHKVCLTFGVNSYAWPEGRDEAYERLKTVRQHLDEKTKVIESSEAYMKNHFSEIAGEISVGRNSLLEDWRLFCAKEKSIYVVLNMFAGEQMNVHANCWFAAEDQDHITKLLKDMDPKDTKSEMGAGLVVTRKNEDGKQDLHGKAPPTFIRTNQFTDVWQCVINTYGVPRYQEANPALFACVTFPFIFGMMYGDVGHGSLLMITGAAMIYKGDDLLKIPDIGQTLHWVRFLIFQLASLLCLRALCTMTCSL
jgi:V-type H+-transporting ATPase subunit a